ncbi:hypothetical protein XA68_11819 [Ophiocordyceps unilateralis]|uniref:Uncharacterized protein n=1 Tax=Ophiocordyceps unilateralis TaxID=268505 RepID=A0A2A9PPK6_OPHUN|nr:hypothetical protein XA68_11819 [Ophiocordyceps unilateralis]
MGCFSSKPQPSERVVGSSPAVAAMKYFAGRPQHWTGTRRSQSRRHGSRHHGSRRHSSRRPHDHEMRSMPAAPRQARTRNDPRPIPTSAGMAGPGPIPEQARTGVETLSSSTRSPTASPPPQRRPSPLIPPNPGEEESVD